MALQKSTCRITPYALSRYRAQPSTRRRLPTRSTTWVFSGCRVSLSRPRTPVMRSRPALPESSHLPCPSRSLTCSALLDSPCGATRSAPPDSLRGTDYLACTSFLRREGYFASPHPVAQRLWCLRKESGLFSQLCSGTGGTFMVRLGTRHSVHMRVSFRAAGISVSFYLSDVCMSNGAVSERTCDRARVGD